MRTVGRKHRNSVTFNDEVTTYWVDGDNSDRLCTQLLDKNRFMMRIARTGDLLRKCIFKIRIAQFDVIYRDCVSSKGKTGTEEDV
ncbi:hypothetical protein QKT26_gp46 [Carcinus maenas nudivirus]|uniref:Uncharacterized protein n=1 Tax=Carcinus maenas nudivirus TaxID=2880837 RepID=A0AAE8Y0T4_9VIRU|nr:hypothetical protein QKT26_gp46 [Carcinus maenas nudivirus]UBZ25636.1 hypothetical protein CmNV_045 [Carcinus maenas nudivirus]